MSKKNKSKDELGFELFSEYADLSIHERMQLSPMISDVHKNIMRDAIPIDNNNVFTFYRQVSAECKHLKKDERELEKYFPTIAPPFEKVFMTFTVPSSKPASNVGVLFCSTELDDAMCRAISQRSSLPLSLLNGAKWCTCASLFIEPIWTSLERLGYAAPFYHLLIVIDKEGQHIDNVGVLDWQMAHMDDDLETHLFCKSLCTAGLMGIAFLHCKNVTLSQGNAKDRVFFERDAKAIAQKDIQTHTLQIEPMKEVLRKVGKCKQNGLHKALHICRGHFSTYTEEKKLFGKVSGTFWIPQHMKGSLEHGKIEKDYRIGLDRSVQ